jgi:hypothetical protein
MRALLLCAMLFACFTGIARSTEPQDRVYKLSCGDPFPVEGTIGDTDGVISQMCAESLEPSPHIRIFVCDGSFVSGIVGPEDALAGIRSPCDHKPTAPAPIEEWTCKDGRQFAAQIYPGSAAFIKAGAQDYFLLHPPASPDGHYERRGVTLQHGDSSAELTGAAGGPYESCVA